MMLKLSKLADYAVVVLIRLSSVDGCQTSPSVASMTGLPEPTVAKVLKALTAVGLVASQRGARGGYRLSRPLGQIPVADVVAAIDGPIAITACTEHGSGNCESESQCPVAGRWDPVNHAVLQALSRITLADMTASPVRPRPRTTQPVVSGPGEHPTGSRPASARHSPINPSRSNPSKSDPPAFAAVVAPPLVLIPAE